MKRALLTIGLVLGVLFVSGAVLCGGIFYRAHLRTEQYKSDWTASGTAFGQTTDNAGCMVESIRQLRQIPEELKERPRKEVLAYFTAACLQVSKPNEDFCMGVPKPVDVRGSFSYLKEQVEKNRLEDKSGAIFVFQRVVEFCKTAR